MRTFKLEKMPTLTRNMFEIQQSWIGKNCTETLRIHYREIEELLEQTQILVFWKNYSQQQDAFLKELIPEIFMDAYISVSFACFGLYKQANVCLRGQLETALRLVYFSTHPVEYGWWKKGSEWFLEAQSKDVWGKEYQYFRQLEKIKDFEKSSEVSLIDNIRTFYKNLSKFVHGGATSFQTRPNRISPKYLRKEFNDWKNCFREVQKYVNTLLILGFVEVFKNMADNEKRDILKALHDEKYKTGIRKYLGLKIRGRI